MGITFKLEITLEKLSLIAAAIKFWNLPNVQSRIEDYFQKHSLTKGSYTRSRNWDDVISYVIDCVDYVNFPEAILANVKNYIPFIGEKIYNWIVNVICENGYDIKYIKKIFWTPYGTVDELKIVKEYWLKQTEFSSSNDATHNSGAVSISIAIQYAQEDFIRDNKNKFEVELNKLLPSELKNSNWNIYGAISTWLFFYTNEKAADILKYYNNFESEPNILHPKILFFASIESNYKFAAKYFWNKLTENEKEACIVKAAEECLENFRSCYGYIPENNMETLIFLLNQMTVVQVKEFSLKHFVSFFKHCLRTWPYQELCRDLLNHEDWEYNPNDIKRLLKVITKYLSSRKKRMQLRNKSIYRILFEKLLGKASVEVKLRYFVYKTRDKFFNCFNEFDPKDLSIILNDKDLKEHKDEILINCKDILEALVLNEKYKDLNIFMGNGFSDTDRKNLKIGLNFFTFYIKSGLFESANKHLIWLYDSESERLDAKEAIDALEICGSFIKKFRLDLADEFLSWRFDTEEDRKNLKRDMIKSDFLCDEVYKIWCSRNPACDTYSPEANCSDLLKWFLESDEAITKFKKTELIKNNVAFIAKYWKNLYEGGTFVDLTKFLEFCLHTPEEIEEVKRNIRGDITWWIDTYMLSDTQMLHGLIDWIFNNIELLKKKLIASYLTSSEGAILCVNYFKKYYDSHKLIDNFNYWFDKSISDIDILEMKKNLETFDDTVLPSQIKACIINFLEKRKKGFLIRSCGRVDNYFNSEDDDFENSNETDNTLSDPSDNSDVDVGSDDDNNEDDNDSDHDSDGNNSDSDGW